MKSVLERTETVSSELHRLELKELKLISIKVVTDHPDTGHFRIRSLLKENEFIEIFEFFFSGNLLKYSYSYVKDDKPIL